jgi:hypothetical protein
MKLKWFPSNLIIIAQHKFGAYLSFLDNRKNLKTDKIANQVNLFVRHIYLIFVKKTAKKLSRFLSCLILFCKHITIMEAIVCMRYSATPSHLVQYMKGMNFFVFSE